MKAASLPAAVLFDMDGTLIDTEPWWGEAEAAYARRFSKNWTHEQAMAMVGRPIVVTGLALKDFTGSPETPQEIGDWIGAYVADKGRVGPLPFRPGALELLAALREAGVPVALVTSTFRPVVAPMLEGVPFDFDAVVTGSDVARLKPDPEPYLMAMEALGVTPEETVVLEDSNAGVQAGLAAGARVIAIPHMVPVPPEPGLSRVASIEQVDFALLAQILGGTAVDTLGESASSQSAGNEAAGS